MWMLKPRLFLNFLPHIGHATRVWEVAGALGDATRSSPFSTSEENDENTDGVIDQVLVWASSWPDVSVSLIGRYLHQAKCPLNSRHSVQMAAETEKMSARIRRDAGVIAESRIANLTEEEKEHSKKFHQI